MRLTPPQRGGNRLQKPKDDARNQQPSDRRRHPKPGKAAPLVHRFPLSAQHSQRRRPLLCAGSVEISNS
jgi:hypothetical protein